MRTRESGFTLLELMIVVAIIGILASLAIANYAVFKGQAYNATAANDARALVPAVDFASDSERFTGPAIIPLSGDGGQIPELPGGSYSPGTQGTVEIVGPNQYIVMTSHLKGDLCYTVDTSTGTGMTVSSGQCS